MTTCTEHQQAADALYDTFIVNLMVEAQASIIEEHLAHQYDSNDDYNTDLSLSSSSASSLSDEEPETTTGDAILNALCQV